MGKDGIRRVYILQVHEREVMAAALSMAREQMIKDKEEIKVAVLSLYTKRENLRRIEQSIAILGKLLDNVNNQRQDVQFREL